MVALTGLVTLLPLITIITLVIKMDSPGPAIFRHVRVGRDGRRFTMYKFRTMHRDNDDRAHRAYVAGLINGDCNQHDGMFKLTRDPRVTRVGAMLRRFSVDEIPQLLNVLRQEMSLVGPRPALPHEVALYDDIARQRLEARPGLTGLWQVSGRCELSFHEMVNLDLAYLRQWNLWLDIKILFKTPAAMVSGRGAA